MRLPQVILRDTRANQPAAAAANEGFLYFVTDELVLERSSGSAWEQYAPTGGGGSQTPWTSDIDAAGYSIHDISAIGDGSANISMNPNSRGLYNAAGGTVLDWANQILYDDTNTPVLNLISRALFDAGGSIESLDFKNRVLYDSVGNVAINYYSHLIQFAGQTILDWANCQLNDASGVLSVDFQSRLLKKSGSTVLNWDSGLLQDLSSQYCIDWLNRLLVDASGVTQLDWSGASGLAIGHLRAIGGTAPAADGTYSVPTSITIKDGIITAIS